MDSPSPSPSPFPTAGTERIISRRQNVIWPDTIFQVDLNWLLLALEKRLIHEDHAFWNSNEEILDDVKKLIHKKQVVLNDMLLTITNAVRFPSRALDNLHSNNKLKLDDMAKQRLEIFVQFDSSKKRAKEWFTERNYSRTKILGKARLFSDMSFANQRADSIPFNRGKLLAGRISEPDIICATFGRAKAEWVSYLSEICQTNTIHDNTEQITNTNLDLSSLEIDVIPRIHVMNLGILAPVKNKMLQLTSDKNDAMKKELLRVIEEERERIYRSRIKKSPDVTLEDCIPRWLNESLEAIMNRCKESIINRIDNIMHGTMKSKKNFKLADEMIHTKETVYLTIIRFDDAALQDEITMNAYVKIFSDIFDRTHLDDDSIHKIQPCIFVYNSLVAEKWNTLECIKKLIVASNKTIDNYTHKESDPTKQRSFKNYSSNEFKAFLLLLKKRFIWGKIIQNASISKVSRLLRNELIKQFEDVSKITANSPKYRLSLSDGIANLIKKNDERFLGLIKNNLYAREHDLSKVINALESNVATCMYKRGVTHVDMLFRIVHSLSKKTNSKSKDDITLKRDRTEFLFKKLLTEEFNKIGDRIRNRLMELYTKETYQMLDKINPNINEIDDTLSKLIPTEQRQLQLTGRLVIHRIDSLTYETEKKTVAKRRLTFGEEQKEQYSNEPITLSTSQLGEVEPASKSVIPLIEKLIKSKENIIKKTSSEEIHDFQCNVIDLPPFHSTFGNSDSYSVISGHVVFYIGEFTDIEHKPIPQKEDKPINVVQGTPRTPRTPKYISSLEKTRLLEESEDLRETPISFESMKYLTETQQGFITPINEFDPGTKSPPVYRMTNAKNDPDGRYSPVFIDVSESSDKGDPVDESITNHTKYGRATSIYPFLANTQIEGNTTFEKMSASFFFALDIYNQHIFAEDHESPENYIVTDEDLMNPSNVTIVSDKTANIRRERRINHMLQLKERENVIRKQMDRVLELMIHDDTTSLEEIDTIEDMLEDIRRGPFIGADPEVYDTKDIYRNIMPFSFPSLGRWNTDQKIPDLTRLYMQFCILNSIHDLF